MSPEQANGREVGPPSDVFSFGAVLTFASTGHGPFGTGSAPALGYRVVHAEPDLAGIPAEIRALVRRCLAKDPAERPAITELLAKFGDPDVPQDWLSPAHPREPAPDAPANAPQAAEAAQDDAPAPAWTPTLQNRPHPAPELTEGRIAAAPAAADAAEDDARVPIPVPTPAPGNRPDPALEVTESMITVAPPVPATTAVASGVLTHVISIVGHVFVARAAGWLILLFGFVLFINSIARSQLGYHAFSGVVYTIAGLVFFVLGCLILGVYGNKKG
jgi:hypothetical protein